MSNKLVKKEWREFFVSEIFTKIQRGKRLTKGNQQNGEVPYVSSTAANNGVDNFIGNSKGVRIFENCLTLANSGSVGSTFFHHYTFVASDHVTALILERPNKYIYLFLSGIIRRLEEKYSFNREINDKRIQREKILLPVNSDGLPDWQFMEDFIKQKEQKQIVDLKDYYADKAVELMISTGSLKNTEWQEFKIGKIFEQLLRGNNKGHSNEDCQFGVSYNGAKYNDNGVTGFVETNGKFKIFKGNAIVFVMTGEGSVGLSVYKKEDFVPSSNVFVGYSSVLNRWNGLFLVTAINNGADRYNYGYIRNEKRLFNEKILLPVNSDGLPDWQFMEDFMKQIERDKITTVLSYYNNSLNNNGLRGGGGERWIPSKSCWAAFAIQDVCEIHSGVRLTKQDMQEGKIPFVGASDSNNGITAFIANKNASLDKDVLGVNYNGSVVENFYHPYECLFSDDVKRLKIKSKQVGKYAYLFLKTMILKQKSKYQYGYKFNATRMAKQKILLPVDASNQPDWINIERFMQQMELEKIICYLKSKNQP
jgi:restriction enzyme bgcI subunit beta